MSYIKLPKQIDIDDRIALMQDDARFDVSSDIDAERTAVACAGDIRSDRGPSKVPKMFLASKCVFNCAYCGCRCSREGRENYCNTPQELAKMAVDAAKSNGHGVFVSSAIYKNADYTQELLAECVRIMRKELFYGGYIHAKVMPGADPALIERTGRYADRLSINIEVAKSSGYERIAKQKNRTNILTPMHGISDMIQCAKYEKRAFATTQTTQLMAGSTEEDDRTIMTLSQALYKKYHLKRVYYTAFQYRHEAKGYENEDLQITSTPYWRMARLYQADRLQQLYGFSPDDVTPEEQPFLESDIDPKSSWALRHLDLYPIEINKADYEALIRIPGIGITYAKRIIEARKHCMITHDLLKKMHISLKRSIYFITCCGRFKGGNTLFSPDIRDKLTSGPDQLSIFDSLTAGHN
jgi:predicted DNA-binding helix-hairpin-helix protein